MNRLVRRIKRTAISVALVLGTRSLTLAQGNGIRERESAQGEVPVKAGGRYMACEGDGSDETGEGCGNHHVSLRASVRPGSVFGVGGKTEWLQDDSLRAWEEKRETMGEKSKLR